MAARLMIVFMSIAAVINIGWATRSAAQSSTTCTVTLVVNFAAGGGTDVVARVFAQGLAKQLGQQVIVENVPGAGAMLGTSRVAKSTPDGCQIAFGGTSDSVNQTLYRRPLYNLLTDFIPLALVAEQPTVLIARKDFPANNLQEFIAYTKANQANLTFGAAVGSSGHLFCEHFNNAIGVKTTLIPYRGGSAAIPDIVSGRIDYLCTLNASAKAPIEAKSVKPIASFTLERSPYLPDLPTADEQGLAKFATPTWFGLLLPKGTPSDIVDRLRSASVAALEDEQVQTGMRRVGSEVVAPERRTASYFSAFLDEIKQNAAIINAAGIAAQ
jgi:tripartite-type tricarboxylate transporter receptor subunit TctC